MNRAIAFLAIVIPTLGAVDSLAGVVTLSYSVESRFSINGPNFDLLPFSWIAGDAFIDDGPGIYQLDMYLRTTNLGPNERGFAAMSFDTTFSGGTSINPQAEYGVDTAVTDTNGNGPGGLFPKWATNTDGGTPGDYDGILVAIQAGPLNVIDPRRTIGNLNPEFFGSIFVQWDGVTPGVFQVHNFQFSIADLNGIFGPPQVGSNLEVLFGVPEPTGIALGWMALSTTLLGVRRRRFDSYVRNLSFQ